MFLENQLVHGIHLTGHRRLWAFLIGTFLLAPAAVGAEENWYSDCDLDLADMAQVQNCFGRLRGNVPEYCRALDFDRDNFLGLNDVVSLVQAMAGPDASFDYAPSEDAEAEQLALELGLNIKPDAVLYEHISSDLRAIRTQFPQECSGDACIPAIRHLPDVVMTELTVQLREGRPVEEFDELNCFFQGIVWFGSSERGISRYSVTFPSPINTPVLSELYRALPEVRRADAGDFNHSVSLIVLIPDPAVPGRLDYAFSYGWGDCDSNGCPHRTTWRFEVNAEGIANLLERRDY